MLAVSALTLERLSTWYELAKRDLSILSPRDTRAKYLSTVLRLLWAWQVGRDHVTSPKANFLLKAHFLEHVISLSAAVPEVLFSAEHIRRFVM